MPGLIRRGWHFKPPASVERATGRWLTHANPLPAFIEECCEKDPRYGCLMRELYARYTTWAQRSSITLAQQQNNVKRNLENPGDTVKHGNVGDKVVGLKLR